MRRAQGSVSQKFFTSNIATTATAEVDPNCNPANRGDCNPDRSLSLESVESHFWDEFVGDSAIAPELYRAAVRVASELEVGTGGEVETPIHDALGWRYTRFVHNIRPTEYAAILLNEDGTPWQLKKITPRTDKDGDVVRYETPLGSGGGIYTPPVPIAIWRKICNRHNRKEFEPWLRLLNNAATAVYLAELLSDWKNSGLCLLPGVSLKLLAIAPTLTPYQKRSTLALLDRLCAFLTRNMKGDTSSQPNAPYSEDLATILSQYLATLTPDDLVPDFWGWVEDCPEIEMTDTEGGKKGLALLSQGFVPLIATGVNGVYRSKDENGVKCDRYLPPCVARFAKGGRSHIAAFDEDEKAKTRRKVDIAKGRFGKLLEDAGCKVSIASWDGRRGKGADDFIAANGVEEWEKVLTEALPLNLWRVCNGKARLTRLAQTAVKIADLSKASLNLPSEGTIGIASAKGTGKTKLLADLTKDSPKVLSLGHRIALQRNLAPRLELTYRTDLDKFKGRYSDGSGYATRMSLCVDGLTSINPKDWEGCDLVLDEVCQLIRHLLTSRTCAQDGKRPVLLAIFEELVCRARRLLIADADLDDDTIAYIQRLRKEGDDRFHLVRNSFQLKGYTTLFVGSRDRSAVTQLIREALEEMPKGMTLFVTTDSKGFAKTLQKLIATEFPELRELVISSQTSGGEDEREFLSNPDAVLARGEYDVVIVTPSMSTGVSIEIAGVIWKVFGVFAGVSLDDADMAQALARVREPVQRVVWCKKTGTNFSPISRETNWIKVGKALQDRTNATARALKNTLRPDALENLNGFDWTNVHTTQYAKLAARQNFSMYNLRDALHFRLLEEGHEVEVADREEIWEIEKLLRRHRKELKEMGAQAIANAKTINFAEALILQRKETLTPDEQLSLAKFRLMDFYCLDDLTVDDVIADRDGRMTREILNLEALLHPETAQSRTENSILRQLNHGFGICPQDISAIAARTQLREAIGLNDFLDPDKEWTADDLKPYADKIRWAARQVKQWFNFTVSDAVSDTQLVHQLLSQLGIKIAVRRSRSVPGHEGEKVKIYSLDTDRHQFLMGVLDRRRERRLNRVETSESSGKPYGFNKPYRWGVPAPIPREWDDLEELAGIREFWELADTPEAKRALEQIYSRPVIERALSA